MFDVLNVKLFFLQIEATLPRPNGRYLELILGSVCVSILDKKAKYDYKDQYERFKMVVNLVGKEEKPLPFLIAWWPVCPLRASSLIPL